MIYLRYYKIKIHHRYPAFHRQSRTRALGVVDPEASHSGRLNGLKSSEIELRRSCAAQLGPESFAAAAAWAWEEHLFDQRMPKTSRKMTFNTLSTHPDRSQTYSLPCRAEVISYQVWRTTQETYSQRSRDFKNTKRIPWTPLNQMWAILIVTPNWGLCLERSLAIWTAFSYKSAAEKNTNHIKSNTFYDILTTWPRVAVVFCLWPLTQKEIDKLPTNSRAMHL